MRGISRRPVRFSASKWPGWRVQAVPCQSPRPIVDDDILLVEEADVNSISTVPYLCVLCKQLEVNLLLTPNQEIVLRPAAAT